MKGALVSAVAGMLLLLLGIFMLVFGNLGSQSGFVYSAFVAIPAALGLIAWSVGARNRKL